MLLRHYTLLSRHKRFRHLLHQGVCIAERHTGAEEFLLFQFRHTYVEVAFAHRGSKIVWAKCFTETEELEPYLEAIDLEPVL